MAGKTKVDLIAEAGAKGIELDGSETVDDLKKLLSEDDPEPELEPVVLDPDQHFFIEGEADARVYPAGEARSRRLMVEGRNIEHVHDHESGCWVYRHM